MMTKCLNKILRKFLETFPYLHQNPNLDSLVSGSFPQNLTQI